MSRQKHRELVAYLQVEMKGTYDYCISVIKLLVKQVIKDQQAKECWSKK